MQAIRIFTILSMLLFSGSTVYSQATELRVAVSIPPQQWLVTQIGGDLVSTEILLDAGQSPHTFIPTPKQITGLFDADIYFLIGMAFEKQVSKKIKQADNHPRLIDTTLSIKKIPILHNYGEGKPCAYGAFHPAGNDPHVWLCHTNLRIMAEAMADALSDADPKNSIAYKENLEKLTTLLNRSDEQIRENLLPLKGETFFVFHPAFGYFAHAYGLKQKAVEVEGKIPTPKKLTALIKKIKNTPVRVIFIQPGFDHRAAQIIADAIDGNLVTINPLAENVVKTMHTLAKEIRKQKG